MLSIKDLASMTGYSVATISRVINGSPKVADKTRVRVEEAIQKTGYHPNFAGRNLRLAASMRLLILLPTIENTVYGDLIRGAESAASAAGYQLLIGVTQNRLEIEESYIKMLQSRQVDGIILANTSMDKHDLNRLAETFPVTLLAHTVDGANVSSVSIDNVSAAYDAVQYLISLGHRKIGMLSGYYYRNPSDKREAGLFQAMEDAGLSCDPRYIVRTEFNFTSSRKACQRLMEQPDPPTAIFCIADSIAIGAIRYLSDHDLSGRVSVMGFDNVLESEYFFSGISTVNQPKLELGRTCVELILNKISDISSPPEQIVLPHSLVLRGSTFPPQEPSAR